MTSPKPMDPLTRYREMAKAAKVLVSADSHIDHKREVLEKILNSTPNPDIALVRIKRIRNKKGEPCCCINGGPSCWFLGGEVEPFASAPSPCCTYSNRPYPIVGRPFNNKTTPHTNCPVWQEK